VGKNPLAVIKNKLKQKVSLLSGKKSEDNLKTKSNKPMKD
jgi:hypothetical protein